MLFVENQPECEACPDDWVCCKDVQGNCESFDAVSHTCTRTPRPPVCLRAVCHHFATYKDDTIQTLLNELDTRLDDKKNTCLKCGGRPELIRLNNKTVEYWCYTCYQQDNYTLDSKIGL